MADHCGSVPMIIEKKESTCFLSFNSPPSNSSSSSFNASSFIPTTAVIEFELIEVFHASIIGVWESSF